MTRLATTTTQKLLFLQWRVSNKKPLNLPFIRRPVIKDKGQLSRTKGKVSAAPHPTSSPAALSNRRRKYELNTVANPTLGDKAIVGTLVDCGLQKTELFYVRDGVVNTYAINFLVPIPANISGLEFSWQALTRHPIPYAWTVDYRPTKAMGPVVFNISTRGFLPHKVETFRIELPCSGTKSSEIEVRLQLNVSSYINKQHNTTSLGFLRNRICLKQELALSMDDEGRTPKNDSIHLAPAGAIASPSVTFYVAVGCACIMLIAFIAVSSSVAYLKSQKPRSQESLHTSYTSAAYATNPNLFIRLDSIGSGSYATIASFQKVPLVSRRTPSPRSAPSPYATSYLTTSLLNGKTSHHVYSKPASVNSSSRVSYYASSQLSRVSQLAMKEAVQGERLQALSTSRHSLSLRSLLYEGTFSRVYKALYKDEVEVLVKTVTDSASTQQISQLLSDGLMMFGLSHKTILSILAVNVDPNLPPLLVYPFTNKGNLKRFLQSCRVRNGTDQYALMTQDVVEMATQVAVAGVYLHTQAICHRDLAARNCMVDEKLRIKVADSALSQDLFPDDYFCLSNDNDFKPVKWLALESLVLDEFTTASDVWSFGVLLWELVTLAQQPYEEIEARDLCMYLQDGYRLSQPNNCPDDLFGMMTCCWLASPEERPTFVQLLGCLQDFSTALGRFI